MISQRATTFVPESSKISSFLVFFFEKHFLCEIYRDAVAVHFVKLLLQEMQLNNRPMKRA